MTALKILALDAGLFGDAGTVRQAIAQMPGSRTVSLVPAEMSPPDWDDVLSEILTADKIITI